MHYAKPEVLSVVNAASTIMSNPEVKISPYYDNSDLTTASAYEADE
jgi:hypothetical protein